MLSSSQADTRPKIVCGLKEMSCSKVGKLLLFFVNAAYWVWKPESTRFCPLPAPPPQAQRKAHHSPNWTSCNGHLPTKPNKIQRTKNVGTNVAMQAWLTNSLNILGDLILLEFCMKYVVNCCQTPGIKMLDSAKPQIYYEFLELMPVGLWSSPTDYATQSWTLREILFNNFQTGRTGRSTTSCRGKTSTAYGFHEGRDNLSHAVHLWHWSSVTEGIHRC